MEQTKELRNLWDRVRPGDVMPAGECPEEGCGDKRDVSNPALLLFGGVLSSEHPERAFKCPSFGRLACLRRALVEQDDVVGLRALRLVDGEVGHADAA